MSITSLVIDVLLMSALSTFLYRLAWVFCQEALFSHRSISAPSQGFGSKYGVGSMINSGRIFCLTFALSVSILSLLVFELTGFLQPSSRAMLWRVNLLAMLINLQVLLPYYLAYGILGGFGCKRVPAVIGAMILLLGSWMFMYRLGSVGAAKAYPLLTLEGGITRISMVGITSLAILSGFGAVNYPFEVFSSSSRGASHFRTLHSRQQQLSQTLDLIAKKKKRLALDRMNSGRASKKNAQAAMNSSISVAEIKGLEQLSSDIFSEIASLHKSVSAPVRSTFTAISGVAMGVFCLFRLVTSAWRIVFWNIGGVGQDPVTPLVTYIFEKMHLSGGGFDAAVIVTTTSSILMGILVILQTRGFLLTLLQISRAMAIGGGKPILEPVWATLLSLAMGTCFTSSVLLMRMNLPPQYRVAITAALGDIQFGFYHRWFDLVFVISGVTSAAVLLTLDRKQGEDG